MNTPTTCMDCGQTFPLDQCVRDREGNFFCRECRRRTIAATQATLDRVAAARTGKELPPRPQPPKSADVTPWESL